MKKQTRNACAVASLLVALWMPCRFNPVQAAATPGTSQQQAPVAFTISKPAADKPLNGTYWLDVSTSDKSIASVEYLLGSKRLGIATESPFKLAWNTAYVADGNLAVQAIARDSFGTRVGATERIFAIKNHGNSITATQPDLARTLHGVVNLSVSGEDSSYYPAVWLAYLDGEQAAVAWTDNFGKHAASVTMRVDTTTFTNGTHELYVGMHSDYWQTGHQEEKSYYNFRGGFERVVKIDNGHALMDIAANYLHVYLRLGERTRLTCRRLFTDNTSGPCSAPLYTISDWKVASVSGTGMVIAGTHPGFATVTITDGAKITSVMVWVRKNHGVPHFSGSGQMLSSYRTGASMFVVSPFVLQPSDLKTDPKLVSEVKRAGINTLSRGFYINPRNIGADYAGWQRSFYDGTVPDWIFARDHGFHIFATGDEVARGIGAEAWWTLNWPWGKQAVQYAMQMLAASGVAIGADMVDEASMMWGATPKPPGKVGTPDSFKSITCAGMTCTMAWPHNPVVPKRFPSGLNFALDHSANRNLNTPTGAHVYGNPRPPRFLRFHTGRTGNRQVHRRQRPATGVRLVGRQYRRLSRPPVHSTGAKFGAYADKQLDRDRAPLGPDKLAGSGYRTRRRSGKLDGTPRRQRLCLSVLGFVQSAQNLPLVGRSSGAQLLDARIVLQTAAADDAWIVRNYSWTAFRALCTSSEAQRTRTIGRRETSWSFQALPVQRLPARLWRPRLWAQPACGSISSNRQPISPAELKRPSGP